MAVLSGCNLLKAVLEVIGALLHREKVKLAAPRRVLYLRLYIKLLGQNTLTTTSVLRFILVLTQFPATGLYGKTSWIHLSNLVTKTNVNGEVFIRWRPDGLMVSALVSGSKLKDVRAHCYCASLVRTLYMTWRVPRHVFQARAPSRNSSKYRADDVCGNLICEYFCWKLGDPNLFLQSL